MLERDGSDAVAPRLSRRIVALGSSLLSLSACSGFEGGDDVLRSSGAMLDPVNGADGPMGFDWSCLDGLEPASPQPPDIERPLSFALTVVDGATSAPPPNLRARGCNNFDAACNVPVTDEVVAQEGVVTLQLFQGFTGFIELRSDTTLATMFFMPAALTEATQGPTLYLPTEGSLRVLGQLNGIEIDPMRSTAAVIARDCAGANAPGVRLREDSGVGIPYYFANLRPSAALAETSADGAGGFVNLEPDRQIVVSGELAATEQDIGAEPMFTRPGWVSATIITRAPLPPLRQP